MGLGKRCYAMRMLNWLARSLYRCSTRLLRSCFRRVIVNLAASVGTTESGPDDQTGVGIRFQNHSSNLQLG